MSIIDSQPTNKNMLSATGFKFTLNRAPSISYFTYSAPIPSISLAELEIANPFISIPYPGDKVRYDSLALRFRVDEDLKNYLEIHNWMVSIGVPESFSQSRHRGDRSESFKNNGIYSDGSLVILTSNQNANLRINFEDLFPASLSELTFDASIADVEYLEATVTFRYKLYTIEKI
jgi:hypothetical protein